MHPSAVPPVERSGGPDYMPSSAKRSSMTKASDGKRDFFISFNQADRAWATWIAWVLEEKGYSVFFQDWDFKGNFVLEMDKAHKLSRRTLAILSPDYLASRYTAPEWAARFAEDATSEHDLLIPVRVRPCELDGLLAQIVYIDLVGYGEEAARAKLLRRVEGIRLKPDEPPLFPGKVGHDVVPGRPAFPAAVPTSAAPVVADRRVPSASWLGGAMALAALVAIAAIGLVTPVRPPDDNSPPPLLPSRQAVALAWNRAGLWSFGTGTTIEQASLSALDKCNRIYGNCEIARLSLTPDKPSCLAVARSSQPRLYIDSDSEKPLALQSALDKCEVAKTGDCEIDGWLCN